MFYYAQIGLKMFKSAFLKCFCKGVNPYFQEAWGCEQ